MTLHEAIQQVLRNAGKPLSASEIAAIINKERLYVRGDKNPVPGSQINARVRNYPQFFKKNGNLIDLYSSGRNLQNTESDLFAEDELVPLAENELIITIEAWNEIANNHADPNNKFKKRPVDNLPSNLSKRLSLFNQLELNDLARELVNLFQTVDFGQEHEIQVAYLIFLFRTIAICKEKSFPNISGAKTIQLEVNKLNLSDADEIINFINFLNKCEYFKGIFDPFFNLINNQFSINYFILIELLSKYNWGTERYDEEDFGLCYYEFLKLFFIEKHKKVHQYSSSNTISKLIGELLNKDINENDVIYDPAVGIGGFFIEIKRSSDSELFKTLQFIGDEINNQIGSLCRMNLFVNGIYNCKIRNCDSLISSSVAKSSVNISICEPPYFINKQSYKHPSITDFAKIKSSEGSTLFLQLINSRLKSNGIAFLVLPNSFLNSSKTLKIRKALIESDLLEYIIDIPIGSGLTSTSKVSLVKFNQKKPILLYDKIAFYNTINVYPDPKGSDHEQSFLSFKNLAEAIKSTQKDEFNSTLKFKINGLYMQRSLIEKLVIEKYNCDLNSYIYISRIPELLENIVEKGENLKSIKELIQEIHFRPVSGRDLEIGKYPFIRISNLSNDFLNYNLDTKNLTLFSEIKDGFGKLIDVPCVLLARQGEKLKPTWFEDSPTPIIISQSILPIVVDTNKILPEYLIYQLNSEVFQTQLRFTLKGTTIPYYRSTDLLNIKIPLPSISEQINRVAEFRKQLFQKFRLTNFINEIKLIEDPEGIRNEIETFTRKHFPKAEQVTFKTELQFEKFPFSSEDISSAKVIKSSYDKLIKYLLIIDKSDEIHGVISIDEENEIDYEVYSEINAYANFLIKTTQFIRHSNASNLLAKFSHTSKNFFVGINFDLLSLSETKNSTLKKSLETEYIDDHEFIEWTVKNSGGQKEDFIAINKLKSIQEKISRISTFFQKTSAVYKDMMNCKPEEFDIISLLVEADIEKIARFESLHSKILVFAKKNSVLQAFADLIQNARKYSPDRKCDIEINDFDNFVEIKITNKVSTDQIIASSKYAHLGIEWLTSDRGDGAHAGLYWAFQSIQESLGEIAISDYKSYYDQKIFQINVKLRKKL